MATAISVQNVSKSYRLGAIGGATLNEDVARLWARVRRKPDPFLKVGQTQETRRVGEHFSALSDVSFDVEEGQVLGIIGRNGAGKSTLLKILSQVTAPTSGQIKVRGRIASLLEVGTGFHPDLSGRENIFLNGAILGMTKAEIRQKFDEIVSFSECEEFIDTPVKRYSSGMYVRLAFAVAAHLEPEILVVDEVLAVGDVAFQQKCLGKMGEVSRGGRTVLFVSHNMVAVQSLCQHAILLHDGKLKATGSASAVVSGYLSAAQSNSTVTHWSSPADAPGNELMRLKSVLIAPVEARVDGLITMLTSIRVDTEFWVLKAEAQLHITYVLVNEQGVIVLTTWSPSERRRVGLHRASFTLPGNLLNSGTYSLRFLIVQNENRAIYDHEGLARFTVVDASERGEGYLGREPGVVQPKLDWSSSPIDATDDSNCSAVVV